MSVHPLSMDLVILVYGSAYQVVVRIPRLRRVHRLDSLKFLKYMLRRRGPVVEKEHDPCVEHGGMVGCHDNRSLVVGVVGREVVNSFQDIGRLFGRE